MTRHTDTIRRGKARLVLEARTERDESSSYRHKWRTEVSFGLLRASGPNTGAAVEALLAEVAQVERWLDSVVTIATVPVAEIPEVLRG